MKKHISLILTLALVSVGTFAKEANMKGTGKTLVVYFSWSGNLDKMAHWVAESTSFQTAKTLLSSA